MNFEHILKQLEQLPPHELAPAAIEGIKAVAEDDLFVFSKYMLGYKDMRWRTHESIIRVLEFQGQRKIAVEPRGTFKSSVGVVAYSLWRLIKNPNLRILIESETFNNSKNFLREIVGHMESESLTQIYGSFVGPVWNETEIIIKQRTKNKKEASVVIGSTDTVKVGQHFDLIINDDMNSNKNSNSLENCQKIIDHVRYNLSILDPNGEYLWIGTRYSEMDLFGHLFKNVLDEPYLAEGKLVLNKKVGKSKEDSLLGD